jgi:hypothetical protein
VAGSTGQVLAGNFILAEDLQAEIDEAMSWAQPLSIIKAATGATRTSTTTSTDDSELTLTFPAGTAGRTYEFFMDLILLSAANAAGDFRGRIAWTNTASVRMFLAGLDPALASGSGGDFNGVAANSGSLDVATPTDELAIGCSTTATLSRLHGYLVTDTADVVAILQWAQLASNANATSVLAGSRWTARRVA